MSVFIQAVALLVAFALAPAFAAGLEPVEFRSQRATLHGVIVTGSAQPTAALVLIHGSGKVERMIPAAEQLASYGFAVLTYDKRGVGESGGLYESENNISAVNLDRLADDAVAAANLLRMHKRYGDLPVGLFGISQAGWIAPIAAKKARAIRFMVLVSGPACTVSEELHFSKLSERDPDFWEKTSKSQVAEHMKSVRYRPDDVDPRLSLASLSIPSLWLYGGKDNSVPVDLSASRLDELIRNGRSNITYRIYPEYDHNFKGWTRDGRYHEMIEWIRAAAAKGTSR